MKIIQKIKCFFGYHTRLVKYDSSSGMIFSKCIYCGKIQNVVIKWDVED